MRVWIRARLSYANVIATLALFISLAGGAYAAFHLPKDSVRSKNVVNDSLKAADIAGVTQLRASKRVTVTAPDGPEVEKRILTSGPFRIFGACAPSGGGSFNAAIVLRTDENKTSVAGDDGSSAGVLNSGDHQFIIASADPSATPAYGAGFFAATTPSGKQLTGIASAGHGLAGDDCVFTVSVLG